MQKSILVTGGEGFVGRNVMRLFGETADSFDLKSGWDIRNTESLTKALVGKKAVIHLAARMSVTESMQDPEGYMETNTEGTRNVAELAAQAGCESMVFFSSAAARAVPGSKEESPYGISKRKAEEILREMTDKIHITILQPENIIGAGQSAAYAGALSIFARNAKAGKPIVVSGDGTQTRDFVYVGDMAKLVQLVLKNKERIPSGTIFSAGTGESVSIKEVAEFIAKKYSVPVHFDPSMSVGILHSKADNKSLLGAVGGYQFKQWQGVVREIVTSV